MSPKKDALEVLVSDHGTVEQLFASLETETGRRDQLINKVVRELSIHDAVEKQILYPVVRRQLPRGDRTAERAISEHQKVEELLADLDRGVSQGRSLERTLSSLMSNVRRHVAEEEGKIFPALRDAVSKKFLLEMRNELDKAKRMAPTRPHPSAPNSAIGTTLAGVGAAVIDRARDALERR